MVHEIKLIGIHKKRLKILVAQKKRFGTHCPPHIALEVDSEKEQIQELESTLKRRLQGLLMKAATYGINTDPGVSMEIEDIQEYFGIE